MTRPAQVERELRFVEAMVELLPVELAGSPEPRDPPEPDVNLRLADGRLVRLEVTEAIESEIAATWNGTLDRIKRTIERGLADNGLNAALDCYIHLDAATVLGQRRVLCETVERIVALVRAVMPGGCEPDKSLLRKYGIEHFRWIMVRPSAETCVGFVSRSDPQGPQLIQTMIDAKAEKIEAYRSFAADEHWLLVVGGEPLSGYVTMGDATGEAFESPFDRTVFYDRHDRACIFLDTFQPEPIRATES